MIEDMAADLGDCTQAQVEVAIRKYRLDASKRFFPRSADLRDLVLEDCAQRRASTESRATIESEFGESRPLMWWSLPKMLWKSHWRENEIPARAKGEIINDH